MKQLTVIQLASYLEALVEADDNLSLAFALVGEVSNLKAVTSGHLYFTLKEEDVPTGKKAQIDCMMWATARRRSLYEPQNGGRVIAVGRLEVYAPQGRLSFIVSEIKAVGEGDIMARLEALKKKLAEEGLFASERKQPLLHYPQRIGIVTSPRGAVIHDIVRVAKSRNKSIEIVLYPAKVQGEGSAEEIAAGLAYFNEKHNLAIDVIVVCRGGGSLEDLWAFNSETVVRAIAASKIPIVSAVGHESDYTLADLAADVRAATPSNAMEIIVPDAAAILKRLDNNKRQLNRLMLQQIKSARDYLNYLKKRRPLAEPNFFTERRRDLLNAKAEKLAAFLKNAVEKRRVAHLLRQERLAMLNPMATLGRGYAIVSRLADGKIIKSATETAVGEKIDVKFAKGNLIATVNEVI